MSGEQFLYQSLAYVLSGVIYAIAYMFQCSRQGIHTNVIEVLIIGALWPLCLLSAVCRMLGLFGD